MQQRDLEMAQQLATLVRAQGGMVYYVGGCVRDRLRQQETTDFDLEVHGISPQTLEAILDQLGQRLEMGASFGIYQLKGYHLDIAMPRKEQAVGKGHRDFAVSVAPDIGTYKASQRRDFTINAMMEEVLTGALVDHFHGQADLQAGIIRHVCAERFVEDPLRVFRAAQFAARFDFQMAEETRVLCSQMDLRPLSRERVMAELRKALLQAEKPSVFFETLRQMAQLNTWFPEVAKLMDVPQNPRYHGEGNVWNHTMLVLDAAVGYRSKAQQPFGFMLAALVHDFGKILCTQEKEGEIHAYGHETEGLPIVRQFLRRLTRDKALIRYVENLVALHGKPGILAAAKASVKATNRMFDQAQAPEDLLALSAADHQGQILAQPRASAQPFLQQRLAVYREMMGRPYVTGKDLIAAGLTPDAQFSQLLRYAHQLRLAGVEKESALKQTLRQRAAKPTKK